MTNKNFALIVGIIVIAFLLWSMNNSSDTTEGYENGKGLNTTRHIATETGANMNEKVLDKSATMMNETTMENTVKMGKNESVDLPDDSMDVFKESSGIANTEDVRPVEGPVPGATVMGNNIDSMNLTNDLGALIRSGKVLTSDQLLPDEDEINEHNQFKVPTTYMDSNLAANGVDKFGVDTIGGSKRNASQDIRGNIPCPKMNVGPFHNSTIDPDYNLKGLSRC